MCVWIFVQSHPVPFAPGWAWSLSLCSVCVGLSAPQGVFAGGSQSLCKKNIINYAVNIANIYSVIVVCCCYCCYCCLLLFYLPSVLFGFLKRKHKLLRCV